MIDHRTYKNFLNGRFVSEGLRITAGIILPALILSSFGLLKEGIVCSVGALCVSVPDAAGPIHHRRNAMLICSVSIFLISLIVGVSAYNPILLGVLLAVFSFIFSMLAIYGARPGAIGIACLLIMVLNLNQPLHGLPLILNSAYTLYGGVWYMCFSLIIYRIRPFKIARQLLGDLINATADYLQARIALYDKNANYSQVYSQLMQKQTAVQDIQNTISELLFKTPSMLKDNTQTGRVLVMIFLDTTDLFERVTTSYQQYETLHKYFDDTDILNQIQQLLLKITEELRNIALAVKSSNKSSVNKSTINALKDAEQFYNQFRLSNMNTENITGFLALGRIFESIQDLGQRTKVLHNYTSFNKNIIQSPGKINYDDFLIQQPILPSLFFESLTLKSNIFRHAVRLSSAVLLGFIISLFLHIGHGYWILLTIIVILKPAYSLTKARNKDRLLGTFLGILIGILLLFFVNNNYILLTVMILFMAGSYIFLRTNYFVSVLLMTPYLLIFFHLVDPLDFKQVLTDRLIDTCIGSAIAFVANIFLVPAWEVTSIKTYMRRMIEANVGYYKVISSAFVQKNAKVPAGFRAERKEVNIALANLSDAFTRMLSEPKRYQADNDVMYRFIILSHTLNSHIATLSYYFDRSENIYTSKHFNQVIDDTIRMLETANQTLSSDEEIINEQNNTSLRLINIEADELLNKRKEEITVGNYETETKTLLIRVKSVVDQFNYIYNISTDILKVSKLVKL